MWLDIIFAIIFAGFIIGGLIRGGVRGIFGLLGIIIGIFAAFKLYKRFATVLPIQNPHIANAVSFIIIFFVVTLLIYLIGFLIHSFVQFLRVGFLNRILGIVLGGFKASLVAGAICFFLNLFPQGQKILQNSTIAPLIFKEFSLFKKAFQRNTSIKAKKTLKKRLNKSRSAI